MICPKCGAPMIDGAKFCGACGFQNESTAASVAPPRQANRVRAKF